MPHAELQYPIEKVGFRGRTQIRADEGTSRASAPATLPPAANQARSRHNPPSKNAGTVSPSGSGMAAATERKALNLDSSRRAGRVSRAGHAARTVEASFVFPGIRGILLESNGPTSRLSSHVAPALKP